MYKHDIFWPNQIQYTVLASSVKGGESAINYIKIFQKAKALEISLRNSYTEYQLMHTFLDIFQQGGKYSARIAIHQAELRKEENVLIKHHYLYLRCKFSTWIWSIQKDI